MWLKTIDQWKIPTKGAVAIPAYPGAYIVQVQVGNAGIVAIGLFMGNRDSFSITTDSIVSPGAMTSAFGIALIRNL
jgi:hypothetical protein